MKSPGVGSLIKGKSFPRIVRGVIRRLPGISTIDRFFRVRYTGYKGGYNPGHFHSPIPDVNEIRFRRKTLFEKDVQFGSEIDLRKEKQFQILEKMVPFCRDLPWGEKPLAGYRFHANQQAFRFGDSISLYCLMRLLKPKKIVEIGSGFSSALMLDTNEFSLGRSVNLNFIDPYPGRMKALLKREDHGIVKIIGKPVQDVPLKIFKELEDGDFLFVDSSHVSKIGSDVNRIFFDILPVLKKGVIIHFHDIFWPFEYPEEWVLGGRSWNEAYILRSFLQYNQNFQILLFNSFVSYAFESFLAKNIPEFLSGPSGSIWLKKLNQ